MKTADASLRLYQNRVHAFDGSFRYKQLSEMARTVSFNPARNHGYLEPLAAGSKFSDNAVEGWHQMCAINAQSTEEYQEAFAFMDR